MTPKRQFKTKNKNPTMKHRPVLRRKQHLLPFIIYFLYCTLPHIYATTSDIWPLERPEGMPSIQNLEVMCGKDHMDVHLSFSHPFEGIVSSKGQHSDPRCVYVPPSTGQKFFSFRIAYARCGTKPDLHGQFYENTVVVQYDRDLLEFWDEAKRLRCEWFNDYEKTASKPPMVIADLDVIQLDFRGDNVDCWMEIQHGKGPWAPPVSGIVPLGSTLTLVVAINDYRGEFDMRVKSCIASDGSEHIIHLSDEFGCVLRPKMISRFLKARSSDDRASVITYAFFHAFKFPDALSVHIKCKVEICRHGCLDHCQDPGLNLEKRVNNYERNNERKDDKNSDLLYDDIIQDGEEMTQIGISHYSSVRQPQLQMAAPENDDINNDDNNKVNKEQLIFANSQENSEILMAQAYMDKSPQDRFPHGPRNLDPNTPLPNSPILGTPKIPSETTPHLSPLRNRRRRSIVVSDRKIRSTDVGVSGIYEVISEADLAFSPDKRQEAVTVFQGRIREEIVYGICLPVPSFSILFILVTVSAVISALIAGSLLYRYQLQREQIKQNRGVLVMNSLTNWMSLRLRSREISTDNNSNTNTNENTGKTENSTSRDD